MRGLRVPREEIRVVLDALDGASHEDHPQRRSQRLPFREQIIVYRASEEEPIFVAGRNISRHGVGFLFSQYMSPGERIRVIIPNKKKGDWIERNATVVRCRHVLKMIHEVGTQFEHPLKDELADREGKCLVYDRPCPYATPPENGAASTSSCGAPERHEA